MSAFAFFGGMAEEYSEIEAAKVKAAAKKAKDDKEAQEDRFTLLRSDGTPVFEEGFTARKGSGGIDQVVAGEVAFSQELDNKLKAFKSVFETKDKDGILYKDYQKLHLVHKALKKNEQKQTVH
jgi:coenzyme F420-reducing hydrogenase alpha subunit